MRNLNTVVNWFGKCFYVFVMTDVVEVVNFLYYIHLSTAKNMPIPETLHDDNRKVIVANLLSTAEN